MFVDTWAWLGTVFEQDQWHQVAKQHLTELYLGGSEFVTSNAILHEVAENSRRRYGHRASLRVLERVNQAEQAGELTVVCADKTLEDAAFAFYQQFDDQDVSLIDCLSFAIMRSHKITRVFTGDRHFRLLGFELVPGTQT
ncbi:MAG: type II toxin-antitoxin system VapC family toxin [Armatimonadota bacterium]